MTCLRLPPASLDPGPIRPTHLVATTRSRRRLASHLPRISSVRPAVSREGGTGYTSAVSRKCMPRSQARSSTAKAAFSSTWEPKIMVPRQSRLTCSPLRPRLTTGRSALAIVVETSSCLAAKLTSLDLLPEGLRRPGASLQLPPVLQRPVEHVQPAEVEQLEGAHRPVQALLDRYVDVLHGGVAALQQPQGLFRGGEQNAVDDEAVDLLVHHHRHPADAAHEI